MKLLNKTIVYYLLFALPVFAICSVFIYHFISVEIKDELDENLWKEKTETGEKLSKGISPAMLSGKDLIIGRCNEAAPAEYFYSDTALYNAEEEEILPYRVLTTCITANGQQYGLIIRRSYVESEDLISSILIPIISMFVILLAGFLFINYWISRKLWNPFYRTIERLGAFELGSSEPFLFPDESIREFSELNRSLNIMTQKAYKDYLLQKEFTENASHEIQTPLAIIRNKIELLIQSKRLGEEEMKLISGIYDSAIRLSHLNKTLLLLTKIENNQFRENELLNPGIVIRRCISNYKEQANARNISIRANLSDNATIEMNPILCEMLFNNLVQNAVRHNQENGIISIELLHGTFTISNSGKPLSMPSEQLFGRFKKDTASTESTGLGLSIARSICGLYSMSVGHAYAEGKHTFTISW